MPNDKSNCNVTPLPFTTLQQTVLSDGQMNRPLISYIVMEKKNPGEGAEDFQANLLHFNVFFLFVLLSHLPSPKVTGSSSNNIEHNMVLPGALHCAVMLQELSLIEGPSKKCMRSKSNFCALCQEGMLETQLVQHWFNRTLLTPPPLFGETTWNFHKQAAIA